MYEVLIELKGVCLGSLVTYCLMAFLKWEGTKLKFRIPKDEE